MKDKSIYKELFPELAGNTLQALLLLIICISSQSTSPLNALIYSLSGDGKSHLIKAILKLIPNEWIFNLSATTYAGLTRQPSDSLKNKIIYIAETHAKDNDISFVFRLLKTEGYFERAITGKDGETEIRRINGPVCVIQTTSTDLNKFAEDDLNRDCVFTVESDKKQKEDILKLNAEKAKGRKSAKTNGTQLKFKEYLKYFPFMNVHIPYADLIIPKITTNRAARIQEQAHEIIRTIAMLNYPFKKEAFYSSEKITIEATIYDYEVAYELFQVAFESQLSCKSSLLMYFRHIKEGLLKEDITIFTRTNVQEWTNLKSTSVKNKLRELVNFNLINIHTQHRSNRPAKYTLNNEINLNESIFIHPNELWSLVDKRRRAHKGASNIN